MSNTTDDNHVQRPYKQRGEEKTARIPIKVEPTTRPMRKPQWIRAKSTGTPDVSRLKTVLREHKLHTVCEEASCPNIGSVSPAVPPPS